MTEPDDIPLLPLQLRFLETTNPEVEYVNLSFMVEIPELRVTTLEKTIEFLLSENEALRLVITKSTSGWRQTCVDMTGRDVLEVVDLSRVRSGEESKAVGDAASSMQRSTRPHKPFVVALLNMGPGSPARVLFITHHLVSDGISRMLIRRQWQRAYEEVASGVGVSRRGSKRSFRDRAHRLAEFARSETLSLESKYWLRLPWADTEHVPRDYAEGIPTVASFQTIDTVLNTPVLRSASLLAGIRVPDLLMCALAASMAQWTKRRCVALTLIHHGRQAIGARIPYTLSVGFHVTFVPIVIEVCYQPGEDFGAFAADFSRHVSAIPNEGIGFGLLRYLSPDEKLRERFEELPSPEVSFNYLQATDWGLSRSTREGHGEWRFARDSKGIEVFPGSRSNHSVNVVASEENQRTTVSIRYSLNVFAPTTAQEFARLFRTVLCDGVRDLGFDALRVDE